MVIVPASHVARCIMSGWSIGVQVNIQMVSQTSFLTTITVGQTRIIKGSEDITGRDVDTPRIFGMIGVYLVGFEITIGITFGRHSIDIPHNPIDDSIRQIVQAFRAFGFRGVSRSDIGAFDFDAGYRIDAPTVTGRWICLDDIEYTRALWILLARYCLSRRAIVLSMTYLTIDSYHA